MQQKINALIIIMKETITNYYDGGIEKNRLELEYFALEGIRTREIISRYTKGNVYAYPILEAEQVIMHSGYSSKDTR